MEHVKVFIYQARTSLDTDLIDIQGYMMKHPYMPDTYIVFVEKDFTVDFKEFFIHEAAHIAQYMDGGLTMTEGVEHWMGKKIDFGSSYMSRGHEIDARVRERAIRERLKPYKL